MFDTAHNASGACELPGLPAPVRGAEIRWQSGLYVRQRTDASDLKGG
jgi:hypothetical protein